MTPLEPGMKTKMNVNKLLFRFVLAAAGQAGIANAETLSREDYIQQVRQNHKGIAASDQLREAADMKSQESRMSEAPYLFGQVQSLVDKKETANPAFQGDTTTARSVFMGLGKTLDTGTQAKIGYNFSYAKVDGTSPAFGSAAGSYEGHPTIELLQPLWRNSGGNELRLTQNLAVMQSETVDAVESFKSRMILIEAEVTYVRLSLAREIVVIRKSNLKRAEKLYKWNAKRVKSGLADLGEILQANSLVKTRELELLGANEDLKTSARAFNALRGSQSEAVAEAVASMTKDLIKNLELPQDIEMNRGDLRTIVKQTEMSGLSARIVEEKFKPSLDVFATFGLNGRDKDAADAIGESAGPKHPTTIIGLKFNAPLGGETINQAKAGYLKEHQAMLTLVDRKKFELESEWINYQAAFNSAKERHNLTQNLEELQKKRVDHERKRHEVGRATTAQVIIAEQDLAAAQLGRIVSQVDVMKIYTQSKTFERTVK